MSEHLKLGELITTEQQRDCVHIAVCPVVAGIGIGPGERVVMVDGKALLADEKGEAHGVADPYLRKFIEEGQRFWLFLYPGSITSLRHDWTHPALPSEAPTASPPKSGKEASEAWLRERCEKAHASYWDLIDGAQEGDYVSMGSNERASSALNSVLLGKEKDEVWHHIEVVLGRKFDAEHREATYFSCSC